MSRDELERKLKTEHIEACLNCQRFTQCDDVGRIDDCEHFLEVEHDKAVIIVRLKEYAARKVRRSKQ